MDYTWTGTRGLAWESSSNHDRHRQRRPYVGPGQAGGVTTVAWPTASKGWRLEPEQGRWRPATNVTAPGTATARKEEGSRDKTRSITDGDTTRTSVRRLLCRSRLSGSTRERRCVSPSDRQLWLTHSILRRHHGQSSDVSPSVSTALF